MKTLTHQIHGFLPSVVLLLALPAVVQAQLNWSVVNGSATVFGYNGNPTALVIPSTTNGYSVVSINNAAFQLKPSLTSVIIPNSVTNIGLEAFNGCSGLTNVTMGNGLTSLGNQAFYNCVKLAGVTLPNGVTNIGYGTFYFCTKLAGVTLGSNVISIGDSAFYKCTSLTNITLGNSLVKIGNNAFAECTSLTNITIPATTTNIQIEPFYDCTSLLAITVAAQNPAYSSVAGVLFDKTQTTLVQFPGGRPGSYAIPISVTTVGAGALWNCVNLTNVTIPGSVTNLPQGPLAGCTSLQTIVVDAQNPFYSSVDGVLFDKAQTTLLQFPGGRAGSYTIPNGVTSVGGLAFSFCNNLTNVIVPASVTSLGYYAFENCFNLTGIFFEGDAPPYLGTYVFYYDTNTTAYYLPGTTGWGGFSGPPVALWFLPNPLILGNGSGFGAQTSGFSFTISWATNISVVVEACTNLFNPAWQPVQTNTLTNGSFYFSDPQWTNYPGRFYRIRSP